MKAWLVGVWLAAAFVGGCSSGIWLGDNNVRKETRCSIVPGYPTPDAPTWRARAAVERVWHFGALSYTRFITSFPADFDQYGYDTNGPHREAIERFGCDPYNVEGAK